MLKGLVQVKPYSSPADPIRWIDLEDRLMILLFMVFMVGFHHLHILYTASMVGLNWLGWDMPSGLQGEFILSGYLI